MFREMRYLEVRKNLRDEVLQGSQGFRDMASLKGYKEKREAGLLGTGSRRCGLCRSGGLIDMESLGVLKGFRERVILRPEKWDY